MKEIRIINKGRFRTNEKIIQIPSKWYELTDDQFLLVTKMIKNQLSETEFLRKLLGISKGTFSQLDEYSLYKVSEELSFISDCSEPVDFFFFNLLPGTDLMSPGRRLKGMCFEQFMHVDTAFTRYLQTEKEEELNMFVTLLYVKITDCFVLPEDNKNHLLSFRKKKQLLVPSANIVDVKKVDFNIRYAIFLNFILIKNWLMRSYPFLFPEGDDAPAANRKGRKKISSPKWLDIFDSFVGDDVAQMTTYQSLPVTTAFRILNKRIKNAQKY